MFVVGHNSGSKCGEAEIERRASGALRDSPFLELGPVSLSMFLSFFLSLKVRPRCEHCTPILPSVRLSHSGTDAATEGALQRQSC